MTLISVFLSIIGTFSLPLAVDRSRSLEAEAETRTVLAEEVIYTGDSTIVFDDNPHGVRAKGSVSDSDYAVYAHKSVTINLAGRSLEAYNRLVFDIEPDCPNRKVVNITVAFVNKTSSGKGYNRPVGEHLVHLDNGRHNRCYLEIADLRRDAMTALRFTVTLKGLELPMEAQSRITIRSITAQKTTETEPVSGWAPHPSHIIYSMTGYAADGSKTAIVNTKLMTGDQTFSLRDAQSGKIVYKGKLSKRTTTIGEYGIIDFSKYNVPGSYTLHACGLTTESFAITGHDLWDIANLKVLNFIYGQRCGYAVEGVHSQCHADLMSVHNGLRRCYAGGWHDAGDLSQQTLQTADVAFALLELYDKKKYSNPQLAALLKGEALWGLEFVLRNRFGDGYHASSMGLLLWTDGIIGTHDDISSVRVQNVAYDNYLYAAYEAYAAKVLADDKIFSAYLAHIAEEDYEFACEKFKKSGFGGWYSVHEHTYCTSESQHMATASWAASMLYEITGKKQYAKAAAQYADYVLQSQCSEPVGNEKLSGFFFRTPQKRSVVHFIHHSREQIYMQALTALCRTQPTHPNYSLWHDAVINYSRYLKAIMKYTAPYGMLPSGVYHKDEPYDKEAFYSLHIFAPADAKERFDLQRSQGIDVGDGFFVKRFPVWFNIYNGNLAVHTSMGKSAAICANFLHDKELMDIAREQLYWIVGKNPFAQSLIYGEGHRYPDLGNFSSGRTTGAMPVGIRSLNDSDEPYWPQFNCACYKEVWVTSAGKWLSLVAETEN